MTSKLLTASDWLICCLTIVSLVEIRKLLFSLVDAAGATKFKMPVRRIYTVTLLIEWKKYMYIIFTHCVFRLYAHIYLIGLLSPNVTFFFLCFLEKGCFNMNLWHSSFSPTNTALVDIPFLFPTNSAIIYRVMDIFMFKWRYLHETPSPSQLRVSRLTTTTTLKKRISIVDKITD